MELAKLNIAVACEAELTLVDVPGDGQCQLHAVAEALNQRRHFGRCDWSARGLRDLMCDSLEENMNEGE